MDGSRPRTPTGARAPGSDRLLVVAAVLLATWFSVRSPVWGKFDPLMPGAVPGLGYFSVALVVAWLLLGVAPRLANGRRLVRLAAHAVVVLGVAMMAWRILLAREIMSLEDPWPPRQELIATGAPDSLPPEQRAAWGARLASHALLDGNRPQLPVSLPAEWPFPRDVEVAVAVPSEAEVDVWARTGDGTLHCLTVWLATNLQADSVARRERCPDGAPPAGLVFAPPLRASHPDVHAVALLPHPDWEQYRSDPVRSGQMPATILDPVAPGGWRTRIDGEIRATASVSGDLVLIGAHRTGSLTVLDRETGAVRWIARLPNWIHQDPITDGRIVVVGFGDNLPAFHGRAPSGVAAYELETGRHVWTAFDPGSVMTSPVIHDAAVVYGTGSGWLRKRDLETGRLLGEAMLPGYVTMAPPAVVGDTVVFTLDHGTTCALDLGTLAPFWCRELADLRMLGHAAPTIAGNAVLVSGAATVASVTLGEFLSLEPRRQLKLAWSALFPGRYDVHAGQEVVALDLHDGGVRWRSPLFPFARQVTGHIAGTAVRGGGLAAIVLPLADTVVVFDPDDGQVAWAHGAHQARGPALIVDDHVVVAGRDGVVTIRALRTGEQVCRFERPVGWDRSGPTVAGDVAIFAALNGEVEAVPLEVMRDCRGPGLRRSGGG